MHPLRKCVSSHRWARIIPFLASAFLLVALPLALAAGPAQLDVRADADLGKYLTDGSGLALYVFVDSADESDLGTPQSRPSPSCAGACLAVWPPLLTEGAAQAAAAVSADLLGTVTNDAGTQVTYDGWSLYFYVADSAAGDMKGEGIVPPNAQAFGGAWYLIAPDGTLIKPAAGSAAPADTDDSGGGKGGYY